MSEYPIHLHKIQQDNLGRWYAIMRQEYADDGFGQISTPRRDTKALMMEDVDLVLKYEGVLVNIFKTKLFKYLSGEMLLDKSRQPIVVTMTIKDVEGKMVADGRGGEDIETLVMFEEKDKELILNKTNAMAIIKQHGGETDDWIGEKVALTAEHGTWFGKKGVRVVVLEQLPPSNGRKKKVRKSAKKSKPPEQPATTEEEIEFENIALFADEIENGAYAESD